MSLQKLSIEHFSPRDLMSHARIYSETQVLILTNTSDALSF